MPITPAPYVRRRVCGARRILRRQIGKRLVSITTYLPAITYHVVKAPGIWPETSDGRRVYKTLANKNVRPLNPVYIVISPKVGGLCAGAATIFPFRLGWCAIMFSFLAAQPVTKCRGVIPTH